MRGRALILGLAVAIMWWSAPALADPAVVEPPVCPWSEHEAQERFSEAGGSFDGGVSAPAILGSGELDNWPALEESTRAETPAQQAEAEFPQTTSSSGKLVRLAGPPAAVLMILQGLVCIGLVQGRRRWLAAIVAVCSVGRAGLTAVPRLAGAFGSTRAPQPTATSLIDRTSNDLPLSARDPEIEFAGLLRRIGAVPAHGDTNRVLQSLAHVPAANSHPMPFAAGAFVLPADDACLQMDARSVSLLQIAACFPPSKYLPFHLFARPPPAPGL